MLTVFQSIVWLVFLIAIYKQRREIHRLGDKAVKLEDERALLADRLRRECLEVKKYTREVNHLRKDCSDKDEKIDRLNKLKEVVMLCPRCRKNELASEKVRNSLSRRDNKTYICNPCGDEEGFFDYGLEKMLKGGKITKEKAEQSCLREKMWLYCTEA